MLRYTRSVACRRWTLLTYFGEETDEQCDACDVCLGRHQPTAITPDDEPVLRRILEQVAASTPREGWFDDPPAPPRRIDKLVEWLVEEDYLAVEDPLDGSVRLTERAENWL
jgi:ATP-dependent DNA helicase RecQ